MAYPTGKILLSKYRIERLLGRGSSGDVYLVHHLALNSQRAIKIVQSEGASMEDAASQTIQERFEMEAKLGAQLQRPQPNPSLLQVHDFIVDKDLLVLEMEYAQGGSLAHRLIERRKALEPFTVEEALKIALQVSEGLSAIHKADLVHRDIKPANILFDDKGFAKLADLGLAQIPGGPSMRDLLSEPRPHPGTPAYMSPEQLDSRQYLKPSSDIYSLGLVLFEMLSGRTYHNLPEGTSIRSLRPDVPRQVNDLVTLMLSSNPRNRPFDGEATANLLRACLKSLRDGSVPVPVRFVDSLPDGLPWGKLVIITAGLGILMLFIGLCVVGGLLAGDLQKNMPSLAGVIQPRPTSTVTVTPTPGMGSTQIRPVDRMTELFVPAGKFWRGSELNQNEQPLQQIQLDAFWIDQTEVTNAMYALCVQAVICPPVSDTRYFGDKNRAKHPVVYVTWEKARVYCEWVGARLPSEAEWEKAARGVDGRTYPWGETLENKYANYGKGWTADTTVAGKYPAGKSPYGTLDMAGNVWEWTADWSGKYDPAATTNPQGPENGDLRIMRGGSSWASWSTVTGAIINEVSPRTSMRWAFPADQSSYTIGFRCARSASEANPVPSLPPGK